MDSVDPSASPSIKTVLVVDSDGASRELVRKSLDFPDFVVRESTGLAEALVEAERTLPDVVLCELVLPDGSGFAFCRTLRESERLGSTPIVIVSHWSREADRILAFECGVDDFVAKPYFARELVSRVRAVLRRSAQISLPDEERLLTTREGLVIDSSRRAAWVDGVMVPLTPREFSLLEALALSGGRVLSRGDLIQAAWHGPDGLHERSVDAHIKSLRRKLGSARDSVETVRGMGYRLADEGRSPRPVLTDGAREPGTRRAASMR